LMAWPAVMIVCVVLLILVVVVLPCGCVLCWNCNPEWKYNPCTWRWHGRGWRLVEAVDFRGEHI
jgi:hypothetical protein